MSEKKKNIIVSFLSLFFALMLAEGVVRLVEPASEEVVGTDPVLKYRILNGADYDARGFRNERALDAADIVVFGDSMTAGNGVTKQEAWPQVLAGLATTSVYSFAMSGFGPVQYAKLAEEATALHPRLALVGLYTGNDMYDAYDLAYHFDAWKDLRDPNFAATETPLIDADVRMQVLAGAPKGSLSYMIFTTRLWAREHVHLYALLGNATRTLREKIGVAHTEDEKLANVSEMNGGDSPLAFVYDKKPELKTILSPVYRRDVVDLSVPTTKEGWRVSTERLRALNATFAKAGTKAVVVIIPTKELAYTIFMDESNQTYPTSLREYRDKERELVGAIMTFCVTEKIDCIDVTHGYVDALKADRTAFKPVMDGHPGAVGYHVIAETVYQYLVTHQLI